jgi:transposase
MLAAIARLASCRRVG